MKNVNKINILKIFVKNLIGNRRFIRLILLFIAFALLSQIAVTAIAGDKEIPDPDPTP